MNNSKTYTYKYLAQDDFQRENSTNLEILHVFHCYVIR